MVVFPCLGFSFRTDATALPGILTRDKAVSGIIELHRRIARGFRNPTNYRLRMILAAGKLTHPNLR